MTQSVEDYMCENTENTVQCLFLKASNLYKDNEHGKHTATYIFIWMLIV